MSMKLSLLRAQMESIRRFGEGTSRQKDFMASYKGILNKAKRSTVDEQYGYGRRNPDKAAGLPKFGKRI